MKTKSADSVVGEFGAPIAFVLILTRLLWAPRASAQTTQVVEKLNDSGAGLLLAAIELAVSGDTINFTNSLSGELITFIEGASDPVSTNGPAGVRCAYVTNGAVIAGFTLTDGHTHASGDGLEVYGGGILFDGGGTLIDCTIISNAARLGGCAFLFEGGTLNDCTISGNTSEVAGGGVYCARGGALNHCTISGNWDSGQGGGGAVLLYGGTLNHCSLSDNMANNGGGALVFEDGTLNNCLIVSNSAAYADGVALATNSVLNHCTLSDNSADNYGGGVTFFEGGALNNCILWGNAAGSDGMNWYEFTDGDAHTDYEEYIADTDPTDSNHWFRITSFSAEVPATVSFDPASVNRQYSLLYSTNLVDGLWTAVAGQVDIVGSGGTNALTYTNSHPAVFYRVEVEVIE